MSIPQLSIPLLTMPHWTIFFAGLCGLLQCALAAFVIVRRAQTKVDLLDGGDYALLRRIRAHGNFSETAPLALLLLLLLELSAWSSAWIITFGSLLVVGRCLHAYSLLTNNASWSRRGGMAMTLFVTSVAAAMCLWTFFK